MMDLHDEWQDKKVNKVDKFKSFYGKLKKQSISKETKDICILQNIGELLTIR